MPPLRTCKNKKWTVGGDDFFIPAVIGMLLRLFYFALLTVSLLYFYFGPALANSGEDAGSGMQCDDIELPVTLYSSLFAMLIVQILIAVNEEFIFLVSSTGTVWNDRPRRWLPKLLYLRTFMFLVDVATLTYTTWAVCNDSTITFLEPCTPFSIALRFSQGIVVVVWVTLLVYALGFLMYLDPLGCFSSTSLLDELRTNFRSKEEVDGLLDSVRGRLHNGRIEQRRLFRRLQKLCSFCGIQDAAETTIALNDLAHSLYRMFHNVELVPSDLFVGFLTLHRDQKKKIKNREKREKAGFLELTTPLRELCKTKLERTNQVPAGYQYQPPVDLDFTKKEDKQIIQDFYHYMRYSLAIYGWPMHVYMNLCCGICQLGSLSCLRCNYRCCNQRVRNEDFERENTCMCGVATMRYQCDAHERDICYYVNDNGVFRAPFAVTLDHERHTVVVVVRGTLSIKDALTDMTVFLDDVNVPGCPRAKMHGGMLKTAQWIKEKMEKKKMLSNAFKRGRKHTRLKQKPLHEKYKLVIVGHSLGAGVASALAVLLKNQYKDLICYAMSPPGCVFNLPLAAYSQSFIRSYVLGNDIVPRLNWRSLNQMKKSIIYLLENSGLNKTEICCQKCFPNGCCNKPETNKPETKKIDSETIPEKAGSKKLLEPIQKEFAVDVVVKLKSWQRKAKEHKDHRSKFLQEIDKDDVIPDVPAFAPGKIVQVYIKKSKKPSCVARCYPDTIASAQWVSMEDLCVIILDEGVVDNHMPNNVMDSLLMLSDSLGMKPQCGELVETVAFKKMSKLDSEGNVCPCTEMNGNGITEENGQADTRSDSIILEEKEVSINLEPDEQPEENGKVEENGKAEVVETSFGEQIVVSVDVNV